MVMRTRSEILSSIKNTLQTLSPQIRIDADKGPFFYLAGEAVAIPLSNASADVERVALLSTLQFPSVATDSEALSVARAFAMTLGSGGYSQGIAYVTTSRVPAGTDTYTVHQGDTFSTGSGGQTFEALESRSLTAANADTFYNPSTRRFELPVLVQAVSAGSSGNIAARTLTSISGGASDFDGVTNLVSFTGGTSAQSIASLYARVRQRLAGLDNFSRGGLASRVQNIDVDRIQAVALTYSNEYPFLFYRLPDTQAIDVWTLAATRDVLTTETLVAGAGQTIFPLSNKPVLSLNNVFVNGATVSAQLTLDESLELGRSTRESSYVSLSSGLIAGDIVDITYSYDSVLNSVQSEIDGYLQADTGALFAADVLIRQPKTSYAVVEISGTALGTFDPTLVEEEISQVVGDYIGNGLGDAALLGGYRSPGELRDVIRSLVPGVSALSITVFSLKQVAPLVATIDIPRNARLTFETADDLVVTFT